MSLTVNEMDALKSTFHGVWMPGNGIQRPVYLGLRELQVGDVLYRGCTAQSEDRAREMLREARFFSITRSGAASYWKLKFGDAPGPKGFLLFLTVKERVSLANVSLSPIVRKAAPKGNPQEWQRVNATSIASHMIYETVHGVWDMDGEEVLIEHPMDKLHIGKISDMNI